MYRMHDEDIRGLSFDSANFASVMRASQPGMKSTIGFGESGSGGPAAPTNILLVTPDAIADDTSTSTSISVGGEHLVSTIDSLGDQDFVRVDLTAGHTYNIGQFLVLGGPSLVPLNDAYIELYDAAGDLITSADGGGANTPSGLDALLTFTAETTGTYYINARAFDQDPTNGTTGDAVGDYELFVDEVDPNDPSIYRPHYDADSPLYAIDWGTQINRINQSVRNPDGDEGTRNTGNAQGDIPDTNPNQVDGKNVISVYFAQAGDVFTSIEDPTSPGLPPVLISTGTQDWEKATVWTALSEFAKVADVVYVEVGSREEADIFFTTYAGTPGPGVSLLGSMSPPDYPDEGLAQFNSGDYRWTESNLQQGGFSYVTLIHEFGHGHGLAHPHDNGGHSGVMHGVEEEGVVADYTLGDFGLNQSVFTMMSYEDGWQSSPYGNAPTDVGYGYLGGLMAFDIAAIQDKYGVNEDWANGDDVYTLKDVNAAGTYYSSIWDGGGTDSIVYDGAKDANIDLRPATLQYETGGGGYVSYAYGIFGGFTVANGVTIENARGGSGNDVLIGNAAANTLTGGAGSDTLTGGAGNDVFVFGAGSSVTGSDRDVITDFTRGSDQIDVEAAGVRSFIGTGFFSGVAGQLRYSASSDATIVEIDSNGDRKADMQIELTGFQQLDAGDFQGVTATATQAADRLFGTSRSDTIDGLGGNDMILGRGGNDMLTGGAGDDVIAGGLGSDILIGGAGKDLFLFDAADLDGSAGLDTIRDFQSRTDRIDLRGTDTDFTFIGKSAFSGEEGQLRYVADRSGTIVQADLDGDRVADFQVQLSNNVQLSGADFIFA